MTRETRSRYPLGALKKLESSIHPYLLKNVRSWKQSEELLVIPSVKHLDSGLNRNGKVLKSSQSWLCLVYSLIQGSSYFSTAICWKGMIVSSLRPIGDGVIASASEVNALKDSFSALDVGAVADIKTEDTVKQTPTVGITDCKCGMPLCICQVSATPTTSMASQERTYLLAFKCF
ncbi:hypothetical protein KY290_027553 [Solanum tuberosum]|uniref:Uncharacterized protein n=1 Tax=Solanum tuberosum TaxID=4113 RepID=A0ABQ7UFD3_SOLTU|nr:hypothetical protein KY285_026495 [Solanum tuberosum]KAH0748321.1 hypothetical protein KY290_027553 [Solanum tuberosum]